jgi:hypothetical protein
MSNSLLHKARSRRVLALASLENRGRSTYQKAPLFDLEIPEREARPELRFVSCRKAGATLHLAA